MIGPVEDFLNEIGTWSDPESGLSVMPTAIENRADKWTASYAISREDGVGSARFEYHPYCDTVFFLSIELAADEQAQGFMSRWLAYGAGVMTNCGVRRATSSPVGYAANVFAAAGWQLNDEDNLGTLGYYYAEGPIDA